MQKLLPKITSTSNFLNKDDQGFLIDKESDEKFMFSYYMDCFHEFNTGADEFPLQTKKYEVSKKCF